MKNRGDKEMVQAFDFLIQSLILRGLKPLLQRLDNEASFALGNYLTKQGITYKLAPPHIHRRNNAERAIQTFKNHVIAGLCSVDPNFPLKLRDKLLPQAVEQTSAYSMYVLCSEHVTHVTNAIFRV
jgi:hypothetical protein